MDLGAAFLSVQESVLEHLWIVLTGPDVDGRVVIVNVTSRVHCADDACLLDVGDHPFVSHESAIAYRLAKLVPNTQLDDWERRRYLQPRPGVSAELLERIQAGALASRFTPRGIKVAIRRQLGISDEDPR